ncbi:MAG: hypothetical protein KGZ85_15175 [Ignavibacterium sp.]|nr:hypothetical protein [Ignavibacterium sp.]
MNEVKLSRQEEEKKFIATTYIDLTRHGNRFGGKIKLEVDGQVYEFDDTEELTLEGRINASEFGAAYPEEVTIVHPRGGDELRHGQTGEDIVKGSGRFGVSRETPSSVIGNTGKVKGSRRSRGTAYKGSGITEIEIQEDGASINLFRKVKNIINQELNRIVSQLSPEQRQELLKPENKKLRAKYREQAQLVGLTEVMKNEQAVKLAAENEAYELIHVLKLSRRGVKEGETKAIPIVGSGMFAESLFKYALVVEDVATGQKKVGFDNVDKIGGFTKQATAFRVKFDRDIRKGDARNLDDFMKDTTISYEFTDPERAKLFEGKKVYLDWQKVKELAEEAKKRFVAQKGK